jgi:hypothetical protein
LVDREPDIAAQTPTQSDGALQPWTVPELVKLEAGAAESGALYGPDGLARS